jgi:hypothetical protein
VTPKLQNTKNILISVDHGTTQVENINFIAIPEISYATKPNAVLLLDLCSFKALGRPRMVME